MHKIEMKVMDCVMVTFAITFYILLSISEWITMIIHVFLLRIDVEALAQQSLQGTLLGMPSLLLVFITGFSIRHFKKIYV